MSIDGLPLLYSEDQTDRVQYFWSSVILYALGAEDDIIANTRYCDYPEKAKEKPKVGGWLDIKDELIEEYKPDLIMTSTFVQDKIVARLAGKGIKVVHYDPKTLDNVYDSIIDISEIVSRVREGQELVDKMKDDFKQLEKNAEQNKSCNNNAHHSIHRIANDKENRLKAYVEEWLNPFTVSGNWVPKIVEIAGGNSLIEEGKISREVSEKEVREFNPEIMIVSWCGFGTNVKRSMILKRNWDFLNDCKIHVIDDSLLNRPSPRLVEGARELKRVFENVSKEIKPTAKNI